MSRDQLIQQHAAEIERHTQAIQHIRSLEYILEEGARRIRESVASVACIHEMAWAADREVLIEGAIVVIRRISAMQRKEMMRGGGSPFSLTENARYLYLEDRYIIGRLREPEKAFLSGPQWTTDQIAEFGARAVFKTIPTSLW